MSNVVRVQLVDDHDMVRAGFRYLLEDQEDIAVVVESSNGEAAFADYCKHRPDLVLMDISMQGMSGLEVLRRIQNFDGQSKVIMVSMMGRDAAMRSLDAGARGFLSKHAAAAELLKAVQQVLAGQVYIDSDTSKSIALHKVRESPLSLLSAREYEIFVYLANGDEVQSIADRCQLSPKTVRSHKSHIMQKLNLKNAIDFARLAIREGVISEHDD